MTSATWIVSFIVLALLNITEGGVCSYGGGCGLRNPVMPVPAPVPVPIPYPYQDRDNDLEEILPFLILLIARNGGF